MKQGLEPPVHVQKTRADTQVSTTQTGMDNGYYILLILGQLNCFCNTYHRSVLCQGTAVAQWLRCCTTIRKVAGSIPDGVIGIFH